jgi:hypothetical protein
VSANLIRKVLARGPSILLFVHVREPNSHISIVSFISNHVQEVQDVLPPDVEASAPRRSIRVHRATKKFTLLITEQRDISLLDNDKLMVLTIMK